MCLRRSTIHIWWFCWEIWCWTIVTRELLYWPKTPRYIHHLAVVYLLLVANWSLLYRKLKHKILIWRVFFLCLFFSTPNVRPSDFKPSDPKAKMSAQMWGKNTCKTWVHMANHLQHILHSRNCFTHCDVIVSLLWAKFKLNPAGHLTGSTSDSVWSANRLFLYVQIKDQNTSYKYHHNPNKLWSLSCVCVRTHCGPSCFQPAERPEGITFPSSVVIGET